MHEEFDPALLFFDLLLQEDHFGGLAGQILGGRGVRNVLESCRWLRSGSGCRAGKACEPGLRDGFAGNACDLANWLDGCRIVLGLCVWQKENPEENATQVGAMGGLHGGSKDRLTMIRS